MSSHALWLSACDVPLQRLSEPLVLERLHGLPECSHPREDEGVCGVDVLWLLNPFKVEAELLDGVGERADVARAVRDEVAERPTKIS